MHIFQIASLLVLALVFSQNLLDLSDTFKKKKRILFLLLLFFIGVYIITYLGNMSVIEWEISSLMIAWLS